MKGEVISFDSCVQQIRRKYRGINNQLGWRFLYTPAATFSKKTLLVFLGLNPGGRERFKVDEKSSESGNAFRRELWAKDHKHPNALQDQVCTLFSLLAGSARETAATNDLMDRSLTANFSPFRSGSWNEFVNANDGSLKFCQDMWRDALKLIRPKVLITMGRETSRQIAGLFPSNAQLIENCETGWGGMSPIHYRMEKIINGQVEILHVALPHLSRFKIFRREHFGKFEPLVHQYRTYLW